MTRSRNNSSERTDLKKKIHFHVFYLQMRDQFWETLNELQHLVLCVWLEKEPLCVLFNNITVKQSCFVQPICGGHRVNVPLNPLRPFQKPFNSNNPVVATQLYHLCIRCFEMLLKYYPTFSSNMKVHVEVLYNCGDPAKTLVVAQQMQKLKGGTVLTALKIPVFALNLHWYDLRGWNEFITFSFAVELDIFHVP